MVVLINGEHKVTIAAPYLVIENKRLYNLKTKEFEGLDGDVVTFETNKRTFSGTVDGYTRDSFVKVRGIEEPFNISGKKEITHISTAEEIFD